jgi:hypothetical protein
MLEMIIESESYAIRALLRPFVTWWRSDYLGADNAGLHALWLQRTGSDKESEVKDVETGFGVTKHRNVIKDLYGVLAWVEKMNAKRKD